MIPHIFYSGQLQYGHEDLWEEAKRQQRQVVQEKLLAEGVTDKAIELRHLSDKEDDGNGDFTDNDGNDY